MIGDRWRDIGAGNKAKCKTIFINKNYNEKNIFKAKYTINKTKEILKIIKLQKKLNAYMLGWEIFHFKEYN